MVDQQKVVHGLSNRAILNEIENPQPRFQDQVIDLGQAIAKWLEIRPYLL